MTYPIQLGGKIVQVDVEVVDVPIDYNMLLGCSWMHAMTMVVSLVFRVIRFPHQENIIIIDQLDYCSPEIGIHSNVPFVGNSKIVIQDAGVGMFKDSSLMGTFTILALTSTPETAPLFPLHHNFTFH